MQTENKLGHNKPPKTVEELINDQGRINLSNSIIKKLKRKVDDKAGMGEQDTVPVKPAVDQNKVTNMGQSGGFENSRGMADVANDDGSAGKVTGDIPKKEDKKNKKKRK